MSGLEEYMALLLCKRSFTVFGDERTIMVWVPSIRE
jgi:hypothetical protein